MSPGELEVSFREDGGSAEKRPGHRPGSLCVGGAMRGSGGLQVAPMPATRWPVIGCLSDLLLRFMPPKPVVAFMVASYTVSSTCPCFCAPSSEAWEKGSLWALRALGGGGAWPALGRRGVYRGAGTGQHSSGPPHCRGAHSPRGGQTGGPLPFPPGMWTQDSPPSELGFFPLTVTKD